MDCKNLLVTKNELIKICDVAEVADGNTVNVCIQQAQNKDLRAILCIDFLNELIVEFNAEGYTGLNKTLVEDFIRPYLSWLAYENYILFGSQTNTKAGFREHLDDDSQPVSDSRLKSLMKKAYQNVIFYKGLLLEYLYDNDTEFPTWKASGCFCRQPKNTFKITGIGKR